MAERKSRPSKQYTKLPFVVPIGAPARGELEFVIQLNVADPGKPFRLELPGDVVKVGMRFLAGIIPVARIVIPGRGNTAPRGAIVYFAEQNGQEADRALSAVEQTTSRKGLQNFRVLIEADSMTFGDVVEAVHKRQIGRESPGSVRMRVSFQLEGRRNPVVSDFFTGLIAGDAIPDPEEGADAPWQIFDCHSHWYVEPLGQVPRRRFTVCHGPCPAGTGPCRCGTPPARRCWGWRFCWC